MQARPPREWSQGCNGITYAALPLNERKRSGRDGRGVRERERESGISVLACLAVRPLIPRYRGYSMLRGTRSSRPPLPPLPPPPPRYGLETVGGTNVLRIILISLYRCASPWISREQRLTDEQTKLRSELEPRAALVASARARLCTRAEVANPAISILPLPLPPSLSTHPTVYRHRGIFVRALRMRPRRSFSICSSPLRADIALLLSSCFASFVPVQHSSSSSSSSIGGDSSSHRCNLVPFCMRSSGKRN